MVPPAVAATAIAEDLGLERVQALLETARASIREGDAAKALAVLERLNQRDHRGLLGTPRALTRIEVLVALGRLPEARQRAARLRQAAPDAPVLKRLASLLDAPPEVSAPD